MVQSQSLLKKARNREFTRRVTSESLEVLASLAAHGAGIAILPGRVVGAMAPSLRRVGDLPVYGDEISFVDRADLRKTASAKVIIGHLRKLKI